MYLVPIAKIVRSTKVILYLFPITPSCQKYLVVCDTHVLEHTASFIKNFQPKMQSLIELYSFGSEEKLSCWFGKKQFSKNTLTAPTGLALFSENSNILFVCDQYQIQVYSVSGEYITSFMDPLVVSPWGIVVESDAIMFTDAQLCSLVVLTEYQNICIGGVGVGQYHFITPRGIACDLRGNLYIADTTASRIRVFNRELIFIKTIGKGKLSRPMSVKTTEKTLIVLSDDNPCICIYSLSSERVKDIKISPKPGPEFSFLTVDNAGDFLITNSKSQCVCKVSRDGKITRRIAPLFSHGILHLTDPERLVVASHHGDRKIIVYSYSDWR